MRSSSLLRIAAGVVALLAPVPGPGAAQAPAAPEAIEGRLSPDGLTVAVRARDGASVRLLVVEPYDTAGGVVTSAGGGDLYVYPTATTGEYHQVTYDQAGDEQAQFDETGTRLAFVRDGDVWTVSLDGTGLQQLTDTPEVERSPDHRACLSPARAIRIFEQETRRGSAGREEGFDRQTGSHEREEHLHVIDDPNKIGVRETIVRRDLVDPPPARVAIDRVHTRKARVLDGR